MQFLWLCHDEITTLFGKDRTVITMHINKIVQDKEIDKKSNVQKMHIANSDKPVSFYSLDVILAVGYRTNSSRAIHFRIWATKVLKKYLLKGYTINQKRLLQSKNKFKELQKAVLFLQEKSRHKLLSGQEQEILSLLSNYAKTLTKTILLPMVTSASDHFSLFTSWIKIIISTKKVEKRKLTTMP